MGYWAMGSTLVSFLVINLAFMYLQNVKDLTVNDIAR